MDFLLLQMLAHFLAHFLSSLSRKAAQERCLCDNGGRDGVEGINTEDLIQSKWLRGGPCADQVNEHRGQNIPSSLLLGTFAPWICRMPVNAMFCSSLLTLTSIPANSKFRDPLSLLGSSVLSILLSFFTFTQNCLGLQLPPICSSQQCLPPDEISQLLVVPSSTLSLRKVLGINK